MTIQELLEPVSLTPIRDKETDIVYYTADRGERTFVSQFISDDFEHKSGIISFHKLIANEEAYEDFVEKYGITKEYFDIVEVIFGFAKKESLEIESVKVTGEGDAPFAISAAASSIVEYVKKFKFDMLYFRANQKEQSRVRLYNILSKRAASTLGLGLEINDDPHNMYYVLINKKRIRSKVR